MKIFFYRVFYFSNNLSLNVSKPLENRLKIYFDIGFIGKIERYLIIKCNQNKFDTNNHAEIDELDSF